MTKITLRCSDTDYTRILRKAHAQNLSMNAYLLQQALDDRRTRNSAAAIAMAKLYGQLLELNQNLKSMSASEFQQQAIELCEQVGRDLVSDRVRQDQP